MNYADGHATMANGRQTLGIAQSSSVSRNPISLSKVKKVADCPSLESRNWLIHLHYTRKEFNICKILIQEELDKSNGKCEFANYILGIILRHEGKIQESLECFQKSHALNPRSVDSVKQVARSLFLLGKHRLAMEAYLEAESVTEQPSWSIFYNLGMCLLHMGDNGKAKGYLHRALQLSRQECSYLALAKIHLKEDEIDEAIQIYNTALESFPDSSDILTSLGILYMKTGNHQEAFEKFGSALVHDPICSQALLSAGSMMQGHHDFDVALSKYKIVSQHIPESAALWNNVGMCFFEKKKYVAAISCLKRANYLSPFDWKALYNLGLVHITTQQYASAFHFLSAAINLRSDCGEAFMLLAVTLRHLGDVDNTIHAFDQAAKLCPRDASIPLNHAGFLHSINEDKRASEQLQKFQELAEGNSLIDEDMIDVANRLNANLTITESTVVKETSKTVAGDEALSEMVEERTGALYPENDSDNDDLASDEV